MRCETRLWRRGFSLIELVIVLAVITVLAAIAIPTWTTMTLRAKQAEAIAVHSGIEDAVRIALSSHPELAEAETRYVYWDGPWTPREMPALDKQGVPWPTAALGKWTDLGVAPDGDVRCTYRFRCGLAYGQDFWGVETACDLDDDDYPWTLATSGGGLAPVLNWPSRTEPFPSAW